MNERQFLITVSKELKVREIQSFCIAFDVFFTPPLENLIIKNERFVFLKNTCLPVIGESRVNSYLKSVFSKSVMFS